MVIVPPSPWPPPPPHPVTSSTTTHATTALARTAFAFVLAIPTIGSFSFLVTSPDGNYRGGKRC
jgi:hypothetical protein